MKCPSCGGELILGSIVSDVQIVREGEKLEPKIRYKNYWCENKKCKYYRKTLAYDEILKDWVLPHP